MLGGENAVATTTCELTGPRVYCLAAPEIVVDRLRGFLTAQAIDLVVERRWRERRRRQRRVASLDGVGNARRVVRNESGRRVAERRGRLVEVAGPRLPASLGGVRSRVRFVRHEPLSARAVLGARSLRLVVGFQAGDVGAFGELYGLWAGRVFAYCERALRDRHSAEDVVQKVALALFARLPGYEVRAGVPFEPWLLRIARNHVVDEQRGAGLRAQLAAPGDLVRLLEGRHSTVGVPGEARHLAFERALVRARLPERQRQVLALRFVFDLSPSQVARVMGTSEDAVRQLQRRALRTLEQRFADPMTATRELRASMRRRRPRLPVLDARRMALLAL
jgi:RNA polymerase sigma-70 factor (ECF subfamily)